MTDVYQSLSSLAFLVVMIMTPFAPRTPKMASDDGSFRISIDSISSGLRKLMLSLNNPSTTYNGLYPLMEFVPRIRISGSAPACPGLRFVHLPLYPVGKIMDSSQVYWLFPLLDVSDRTCQISFLGTTVSDNYCFG